MLRILAWPNCYVPAQIKSYLGLTGTGYGQTPAIVTAYNAPTIATDLAAFDTQFGLPAPPSFKRVSKAASGSDGARRGTRTPTSEDTAT